MGEISGGVDGLEDGEEKTDGVGVAVGDILGVFEGELVGISVGETLGDGKSGVMLGEVP